MTTLHTGDDGSSNSTGQPGLIPCTIHPGCWVAPYPEPEGDPYAYELSYADMLRAPRPHAESGPCWCTAETLARYPGWPPDEDDEEAPCP